MNADITGDYGFHREVVSAIPGWLIDFAALATMRILRWQQENVARAGLLEIGVFQGKYFSLLLRSAQATGEFVLGLDTFQYAPESHVRAVLERAGFTAGYDFVAGMSTDTTAERLLAKLGGTARFISIDGSHEREDVHWDLRLAEQILSPGGIISVDDFLNPVTLGVNEGVHAFFSQFRNLEPVFFTSNKLFLCRPSQASRYRTMVEDMLMSDPEEPVALAFQAAIKNDRSHAEQHLWGKLLLVA